MKMLFSSIRYVTLLCYLLTAAGAHAGESALFDMSLDDLMQIEVVTKNVESISQSPGTVSTYYPEQLREIGLSSFEEILSFAAGVEVNRTIRGDTPIQLNGLVDTANQKILFLLNGVPYWMASHGNIPLKGVPITAIEKIEIIRGPASVLYGTNSSAGVISVVTKEGAQNSDQISGSTNGTQNFQALRSASLGELQSTVALEANNSDGYSVTARNTLDLFDFDCFCYPQVDEGHAINQQKHYSLLGTFKYNNWSGMLQRHAYEHTGYSASNLNSKTTETRTGELASVNYSSKNKGNKIEFYSDWNRFYFKRDIENIFISFAPGDGGTVFANDGKNNYRWRTGANAQINLQNDIQLLSGIEYEKRNTGEYKYFDGASGNTFDLLNGLGPFFDFQVQPEGHIILIEKSDTNETSLYSQVDKSWSKWRAVVGARYVDNSFSGTHTSPKLSLVYNLAQNEAIKLLYGEGYNTPSARQSSGRDLFGRGLDISVDAEIIKTGELAYSKTQSNFFHSVTAFYTEAHDLIQFVGESIFDAPSVQNSPDTLYRSGIEYEANKKMGHTTILGNVTYLRQGNTAIDNDITAEYASKILARLGVRHQRGTHAFGTSLRYASKRKYVSAQSRLNLSYTFTYKKFSSTTTLVNALDETIEQPDVGGNGPAILETEDGPHLRTELRWNF